MLSPCLLKDDVFTVKCPELQISNLLLITTEGWNYSELLNAVVIATNWNVSNNNEGEMDSGDMLLVRVSRQDNWGKNISASATSTSDVSFSLFDLRGAYDIIELRRQVAAVGSKYRLSVLNENIRKQLPEY